MRFNQLPKLSKPALLFCLATLLAVSGNAHAEAGNKQGSQVVVQSEEQSSFKGLLYDVWNRLRALTPDNEQAVNQQKTVATIGVRGAQTPPTREARRELKSLEYYENAQRLMEKGKFKRAIKDLRRFGKKFPQSTLKPNAKFAMGLSQAGLGQADASIRTMEKFIEKYPEHELVADARQLIAQLKSGTP